jgi:DNA-binding helix-hairpin-helix protein with protein kinase domain
MRRWTAVLGKVIGIIIAIGVLVTAPDWLVAVMAAIIVVAFLPLPGAAERKARVHRFHDAERAWNEAFRAAESALSVDVLLRKRRDLERLRSSYETCEPERQKELAALTQNARALQLQHYLERYLIRAHAIPDIGAQRKATLAAWGIHTAADVSPQRLATVHGFGPTLRSRLMAWRLGIEAQFVFDAARAVPQQEIDALEYRWRRRRADLEAQIRAGAAEARRANQAIRQRRVTIANELAAPARAWAQASADLEAANARWRSGK